MRLKNPELSSRDKQTDMVATKVHREYESRLANTQVAIRMHRDLMTNEDANLTEVYQLEV